MKRQHTDPLNQKGIERQRVESECDRFFALSSDILGIVGFDGYFKRLSPACEQILGFSQDELLATPFLEFVHPDDRAATVAIVQRLVTGERVDHFENRYRCKEGSYKWLSWSGVAVVEEETIYCTARDITAHKQAEETLQQSKQQYESLIHSLNGIVWEFDLRTQQFVFVSQKAEDILGYPVERWLTEAGFWENHIHADDREWVVNACYQFVVQKQEGQLEYRMIAADDRIVWLHDIVSLVIEADQPIKLRGVLIDISDRKHVEAERTQIEKAFRTSEQRFRTLAQCAPVGIYVTDANGLCTYVNDYWCELSQLTAEQAVGEGWARVLHPDDRQRVLDEWHAVVQHRRDFVLEYRYLSPDGTTIWVSGRAIALRDETGNASSFIGTVNDITERKHLEEALRLADFSFDRSAFAAVWIGNDARVLRVNEGSCQMLGYSREELQSKYVYELDPNFSQELWSEHWQLLQQQKTMTFISQLQRKDGSLVPIEATLNYLEFNGNEYNFAFARDISERLQAESALQSQREQEQLVVTIAQHIRQSLNLEEILDKTVTAVRAFLKSDRVLIYHLEAGTGGRVTAESVSADWGTALGTVINDCYFADTYAQLYQQGRVQAVDDIYAAELTPCHIDLLAQFQVRANLAVPIAQEDKLWGLLVVQQCGAPRHWQPLEINLLRQLGMQVAIAIQQSELYQQAQTEITQRQQAEATLRQQAEREKLLGSIAQRIRLSLDPMDVLSTTVTEVRQFLQTDRTIVFRFNPDWSGVVIVESVNSPWKPILGANIYDPCFTEAYIQPYQQGRVKAIEDIFTAGLGQCHVDLLTRFQVRANLVVPILQGSHLWGLLVAHQCSGSRQWQSDEVDLLQQLSTQVAIAIQQAELHQQVQQLNANLEIQVQERTLELQQALEFEALLKRITDKVRDSLDEAQILQTAVQELTIGLKVQCCDTGLYDFEQGSSTIHFEYITSGVLAAKGQTFLFSNLAEVYEQLLQGRYVQFSTTAAPGCWRAGSGPQFTILSCPLMDDQGVLGDLWLFRPCEDSFNALEVRFVEQVANQCAIALRQSRLYQAAQAQVIELERLNHLKDDFLSTVSHELRTPMSNIKMAIQMLEVLRPQADASNSEPDRTSRYFNILRSECQREINLINDLLDLTRLDAGTEPLSLATIDLQILIPHILESFEHRICNQQQQLQICIPAALPPITTDLSYLERILTELLNNACKYTPAGEQIMVSAEAISGEESHQETSSPSLLITVCNSGVEIPSSELEHVFDKFYRIPNNDPWKHGGTGLGLALVKRLVEKLNGKIAASSHHEQTIFTVQLPLVQHETVGF